MSVLVITYYCMYTHNFNKSSKIVGICIYILFIISYVLRILLDICESFGPHKRCQLKVMNCYAITFNNFVYILSNLDLWKANKYACFVLSTWHDSYAKIRDVLFSCWPSKKLRETEVLKVQNWSFTGTPLNITIY